MESKVKGGYLPPGDAPVMDWTVGQLVNHADSQVMGLVFELWRLR